MNEPDHYSGRGLEWVGTQAQKCRDDAIASARKILHDSFDNKDKVEIGQSMKKNNSKFYKCSCNSHALEIDTSFREDEGEVYFSIWQYGRINPTLSLRERIRWCWRILTTGQPWADSVCLKQDQCDEIIRQLNR